MKKLAPIEAIELLQNGTEIEYQDEVDPELWWTLHKDQPIRLLWERELRLK